MPLILFLVRKQWSGMYSVEEHIRLKKTTNKEVFQKNEGTLPMEIGLSTLTRWIHRYDSKIRYMVNNISFNNIINFLKRYIDCT